MQRWPSGHGSLAQKSTCDGRDGGWLAGQASGSQTGKSRENEKKYREDRKMAVNKIVVRRRSFWGGAVWCGADGWLSACLMGQTELNRYLLGKANKTSCNLIMRENNSRSPRWSTVQTRPCLCSYTEPGGAMLDKSLFWFQNTSSICTLGIITREWENSEKLSVLIGLSDNILLAIRII